MQSGFALGKVWGLLFPLNLVSSTSWAWAQSREQGLCLPFAPCVDLCQKAQPILGYLLHSEPISASWHSSGKMTFPRRSGFPSC